MDCLIVKLKVGNNLFPFVNSVPGIHFWHFGFEFLLVALHKATTGYQNAGLAAMCLDGYLLQYGVDALFLGVADKAAGVDYYGIAVVALPVEVYGMAQGGEAACEVLAVDGIFGAAEGDDVNLQVVSVK